MLISGIRYLCPLLTMQTRWALLDWDQPRLRISLRIHLHRIAPCPGGVVAGPAFCRALPALPKVLIDAQQIYRCWGRYQVTRADVQA